MSRDLSVFTNYVEDSYLLSTVYQIYLSIGKVSRILYRFKLISYCRFEKPKLVVIVSHLLLASIVVSFQFLVNILFMIEHFVFMNIFHYIKPITIRLKTSYDNIGLYT